MILASEKRNVSRSANSEEPFFSYPPPMDVLCNELSVNDESLEYLHEYDEYNDYSFLCLCLCVLRALCLLLIRNALRILLIVLCFGSIDLIFVIVQL